MQKEKNRIVRIVPPDTYPLLDSTDLDRPVFVDPPRDDGLGTGNRPPCRSTRLGPGGDSCGRPRQHNPSGNRRDDDCDFSK